MNDSDELYCLKGVYDTKWSRAQVGISFHRIRTRLKRYKSRYPLRVSSGEISAILDDLFEMRHAIKEYRRRYEKAGDVRNLELSKGFQRDITALLESVELIDTAQVAGGKARSRRYAQWQQAAIFEANPLLAAGAHSMRSAAGIVYRRFLGEKKYADYPGDPPKLDTIYRWIRRDFSE